MTLKIISKVIKKALWNPITIGLVMFAIGARLHETGHLAGFMGKDHKGATVMVTGQCKTDKNRTRTLAEDYVKVTKEEAETITGVLRLTREIVTCQKDDVNFTAMPYELLADIMKEPPRFPELPPLTEEEVKDPDWKKLAKQTLTISGTCKTQDDKFLNPFTDEAVDVTDVKGVEGEEARFTLFGIRRSDKKAIRCDSLAIKYDKFRATDIAKGKDGRPMYQAEADEPESYLNQILLVTGVCIPDKRTLSDRTRKFAFYKLANSKIQVLEEYFDEDLKVKKLVGTALDQKYRGDIVVCDKTKFPFNYRLYDAEAHKLETGEAAVVPTDQTGNN